MQVTQTTENRKQKTRNRNGNSNNDSAIRGNSMRQSYCMCISTLEIWRTSKSNRLLIAYSVSRNYLPLSIQTSDCLARTRHEGTVPSQATWTYIHYDSRNEPSRRTLSTLPSSSPSAFVRVLQVLAFYYKLRRCVNRLVCLNRKNGAAIITNS